jgi:hypothetical protein
VKWINTTLVVQSIYYLTQYVILQKVVINRWMRKGLKYVLVFVLCLSAFLSCDPTDFELPAHQANLYLPIIDLELSIEDLVLADTTATLNEDSTGLVSLNYRLSDSRSFEELFPVFDEKEEFTIPGLSSEIPDIDIHIPLNAGLLDITPGYYADLPPIEKTYETEVYIKEFIEAEFKRGTIRLEMKNEFPFVISAGLLIELVNNGEQEPFIAFELPESIIPGNTYTFANADLSNKHLTGEFTFRINDFSTPGGTDLTINPGDKLDVSISLNDIALNTAVFLKPEFTLPSVNLIIPLQFSSGALVEKLRIDSGKFLFDIPELESFFVVKVTLPTATQLGNPVSFILGNSKAEISLENLEFDLSTFDPPYNRIPIEIQLMHNEAVDTVHVTYDTPLEGSVMMFDIDYDYLKGYLGKTNDMLKESVELDFFHQVQSGELIFNNPQITMTFTNGVGAGGTLLDDGEGLYIRGSNQRLYGDRTATIGKSLEGLTIDGAYSPEEPGISTVILDENSEPEFNELFTLFPTLMEVRIPVIMGTDVVDMNQFLDDKSRLDLDMELELPLNVAADRLIITDTSEIILDPQNRRYALSSGKFLLNIESYFPFELEMQSYFLDSNKLVLDSLFDVRSLIEPAVTDVNGEVTGPAITELQTYMDSDQLDNLANSAFLVAEIRIQTQEGQYVRLLSSYKIYYKLTGDILTDIIWNQ